MLAIPNVGLGTWQMRAESAKEIIPKALEIGYRHFDCAACCKKFLYVDENEHFIGESLESALKAQNILRKDIFITSKLWCTYFRKERAEECLKNTLRDLKTDYVDLYLMHWPFAFKEQKGLTSVKDSNGFPVLDQVSFEETWRVMESFVDKKLVKHIGVSNFSVEQIKEILSFARIKPSVNQIENHPYLPEPEVVKFCQENDIHVTAYSPLGGSWKPVLRDDSTVKAAATMLNISPAQLLLNWQVKRGLSVIPKTSNPKRLLENFTRVEIPENVSEMLFSIETRHRYCDPQTFWNIAYPE